MVALKSLKDPQDLSQFQQEAKLLQSLSFPFVVQYLGIYIQPETNDVFLVMEYMSQGSLNLFLQTHEVNQVDLMTMAVQAAAGMQFLESKKIIHRWFNTIHQNLSIGTLH